MGKLSLAVAVSIFFALGLFGQALTSLSGTVTDPSGAVVPGAQISILQTETGQARDTVADGQGRYNFLQIQPGTYKLTAKATGFADVQINNVQLLVNSPATIPILFEKVGSVATTIAVEAAAVQVNTTDASLGNAIGTQAIMELPFFARNITGLLASQPGVTNFESGSDRDGAVNGGKSDQANVTLDGIDVNDQANRSAFTSVLRVTLDSVQEFRSTTLNGTAEQGRSSGAQIALVTKTGTNNFHGSLYEYHRNTLTAANTFFNNASGVKRPALLINVFGVSVGGPIIKNRTFFFLNYEGRRDASASNVQRTVPSDLLRQGVVQFNNTAGQLTSVGPDVIKNVVDPLHIGPSATVLKVFNQYPHGNDNTLGDGLNFIGYRFTAPVRGDQNTYIARFDHQLDSAGKHQLFFRGNLQNDSANGVPQFPGAQPNSVGLNNSKGYALGWTALLRPNLVSTFRYGFTRAGAETTGIQSSSFTSFRNLSPINGVTDGFTQIIPVHDLSEDFAYNKGAHDIRVGAVVRFITNNTRNYSHSFNSASTNASWLRGTGDDVTPASLGVSTKDAVAYADAMVALLGIVTQGNGRFNYNTTGDVLPVGAPVVRKYKNQEYEPYLQDTWKATRNLTITAGVRFSFMPAVYEANGQQISSDISLSNFLNMRGGLAQLGKPQSQIGLVTEVLASSPQGHQLYPDHKNWAPRLALAYSPKGDSGLSKFFFGGPGKSSIRAGFGMFYDLIGQPLVATGDASAFGLSTTLVNASGVITAATAPRFTDFNAVPGQLVRPAPKGGFPVVPPSDQAQGFAITNSIDDALKAPYSMTMNLTLGREFGHGLFLQASYVGRLSRNSLINRDLAMPTDLKDPKSGQTYFQAASQLAKFLINGRAAGVSKADLVKQTQNIPFFENFWAPAAGNGLTATQVIAQEALYNGSPQDFTTALADIDEYCNPGKSLFTSGGIVDTPACSILGPNAMFNSQYSALSGWSSIGGGSYHALQVTVRKRFSEGLLFDLNYTYGKSEDLASRAENAGSFAGFVVNTWNPGQLKAVSDYDTTHLVNAFTVWQLPFGRGKRFAGSANRFVDAFIGGWQLTGSWSQSSGLPVSPGNGRRWPTNWNITGNATPNGNPLPPVTDDRNAPAVSGKGGPNLWSDPKAALAGFGFTLPGQTGTRNTIRGEGVFNITSGLSKRFIMPYSEKHSVQFRWETFNVTNTTRFDPGTANLSLTSTSNWGKLTSTLGSPRQMQFALRYEF